MEWRWSDDPIMVYFWIHILLMANWKDREWHDKVIKRGSFVTTISNLSGQLNLSTQQVRTCLDRLKTGGEIKTNSSNTHTLITICKYDDYQCQTTNEQQTNNKPITTTKEEYNTSDTNVSSYSIQEEKKVKKDGDIVISPQKDRSAEIYRAVLDLWNSYAKRSVPKIKAVTPARRDKVKLRIEEMGGWESAKVTLDECFKKISESDFCNGATGKWAANFDWFFDNGKNWVKVLEGNYDNRKEKSQFEQLEELYQKGHEYYGRQYGYGGASAYGNPAGGRQDSPDEQ